MPRYRVFGTKYQNYYTHVSAADEYAAAEAANASPSTEWFEVTTDDVIEATDVFLDEQTITYDDESLIEDTTEDMEYHPGFDKIVIA
jgi:Fic family protein